MTTKYQKNKSDYVKKFYDSLETALQQKQTSSSTPSIQGSSASQPIPANLRYSITLMQQQAKKKKEEKKIQQYINEEDQYILKNDDTQVEKKYENVLKQRKNRLSRLANITGKHSFEFIPGIKNIKTPCKKQTNKEKTCLNISSIKKLAKNSVQKEDEFEFEKLLLKYILNNITMDTTLVNMLKYRPSLRYITQRSGIPP